MSEPVPTRRAERFFLLVFLAIVGAGAAWVLSRTQPEPEPEPEGQAAIGPASTERVPAIDVISRGEEGEDLYWIGVWRNPTSAPVRLTDMIATLTDGAGNVVAEARGAPLWPVLQSREETYALVRITPQPPHDVERVRAAAAPTPHEGPEPVRLFVDGTHLDTSGGRPVVRAQVRVPGPQSVRIERLVAIGLSAQGKAVAWSEGEVPAFPQAPGASLDVSVAVGPLRIAEPAAWTLIAVAAPAP